MIHQLKAVIGFQDSEPAREASTSEMEEATTDKFDADVLKTRIETLDLSQRTLSALEEASIRTVGGLVRKSKEDILALDGIGPKGLDEIISLLDKMGTSLSE